MCFNGNVNQLIIHCTDDSLSKLFITQKFNLTLVFLFIIIFINKRKADKSGTAKIIIKYYIKVYDFPNIVVS